ncbi:MAG: DUF5662 family protein [Lachnospiraceae bacterium]|nr:DUF5662 family protein [Lachnospiraceae bacterium]
MCSAWKHLRTILHHKNLVRSGCFKVGLYKQGMLHDLSKYSPSEFLVGAKYYQGDRSPNNAEREDRGYTSAWLHHKGRNKHHMEYWIDYSLKEGHPMAGMKMPTRYVVEMVVDRISASKNYQKERYQDDSALKYYEHGRKHYLIHPDTEKMLYFLLKMVADRGEEETYHFIRREILKNDRYCKKHHLCTKDEYVGYDVVLEAMKDWENPFEK